MANYIVEAPAKKDIPAIATLISNCLGTMNFVPSANESESFASIQRQNEQAVAEVLERTLVARDTDGKIIGVCALDENTKGDYFQIGIKEYDEVAALVVDENFRKQNIGSALLSAIAAQTDKDIVFEAWGDNGKAANAHYVLLKTGFIHVKSLPGFYQQRGDCPFCVHRERCNKSLCTCDIYVKRKNEPDIDVRCVASGG